MTQVFNLEWDTFYMLSFRLEREPLVRFIIELHYQGFIRELTFNTRQFINSDQFPINYWITSFSLLNIDISTHIKSIYLNGDRQTDIKPNDIRIQPDASTTFLPTNIPNITQTIITTFNPTNNETKNTTTVLNDVLVADYE
eukprot:546572_1